MIKDLKMAMGKDLIRVYYNTIKKFGYNCDTHFKIINTTVTGYSCLSDF